MFKSRNVPNRNTFQKSWQTWRWSFGLEIKVNCMAVVMKGFTQLRVRQCWLQWTRHPPPLWFHSLFSRVLVAAVGLFSRNFDSWIWFLCLFQHQRWLYSHVHTICCFYWRILSLITLCKGCPVPLVEMRYADNACSSLFNDLYKFSLFSVISLVLAIEPPQQFSKSIWRLGYWRYKKAAHRKSQWKYFELRASHFKHIQLQGESKFSVMIGWVLQSMTVVDNSTPILPISVKKVCS